MRYLIVCVVIFSGLLSCSPEKDPVQTDPNGVITSMPFIWKSRISEQVLGGGLFHGFIIEGKGIICVGQRKSSSPQVHHESYLMLKNIQTGENVWVWDDLFGKVLRNTLNRSLAVFANTLVLHDLNADYGIDLLTGKTLWKRERIFSAASEISGLDSLFYFSALSRDSKDSSIIKDSFYRGSFATGEVKELTTPRYSREYSHMAGNRRTVGMIRSIHAFRNESGRLLTVPFLECGPETGLTNLRAFTGLYNLDSEKWIHQRISTSPSEYGGGPSVMPVIVGNKGFVTSLTSVTCFDLTTAEVIWQKRVTSEQTSFLDMIVVDNKVVVNSGDATLYCLDANSGANLWAQKSSSFASDLYHQNGVLYLISTQNLIAVDMQSGKLLMNMPSPDRKEGNGEESWFWGFVIGTQGANGGKGRIFVTSNLHAFCFEAIR